MSPKSWNALKLNNTLEFTDGKVNAQCTGKNKRSLEPNLKTCLTMVAWTTAIKTTNPEQSLGGQR